MNIRLKKNVHFRFYVLLALLITFLFIRYALQIDIPRIVLTTIIAIIAVCGNRDEILAIAMCCIPLHEAVDLYYSIIACAVAYVLKNSKRIRIDFSVILVAVMIIWELLHCFDSSFSAQSFLITIIPLLFLIMILCADVSNVDYGFVIRTMATVVATMCITLLANLIIKADYNLTVAFSNLRRLGLDLSEDVMIGGVINPNSLGIICVLVITAYLQLRAVGQNKRSDTFLMLVLLIFGTLTSSRTFLICLIMMAVLVIMGQRGDISKRIKFLGSIVVFAVIALLLLNWCFPDLMEYYINRFRTDDITTGRDRLMRIYHNYISNNPNVMFFGVGLTNLVEKLTKIYRVAYNVPHNSIQEIIVAWGIPGLIMFVFLCIMMVIKSKRYCRRQVILNYIPFLIILAKSMAGQLLASSYTMLALSFAYLSLCQNFSQDLQSK